MTSHDRSRDNGEAGIALRKEHYGLLAIHPTPVVQDPETLSVVYTPGVATPCLEIQKNELVSFDHTMRGNTIAVVSDGSAVYGLGNIGATASIPMLESKCIIHKSFAGTDAVPVAIDTSNPEEFVEYIRRLEPTFGGFHLEGIKSPRCFEIEEKLKRALTVPVMHGEFSTAVVVCAALLNAIKVVGKRLQDIKVVIRGAGESGVATVRLLRRMGVNNLWVCDEHGLLYTDRHIGMNWIKAQVAKKTNPTDQKGSLEDVLKDADVYIGYMDCSTFDPTWIKTMGKDPIVFPLAMPAPEIDYDTAKKAGATIVGTQLFDSPNTLRVSMGYPGIFRGALDVRACSISTEMLISAAYSMAGMIADEDLRIENILPEDMGEPVAATVARAVAHTAIRTGLARQHVSPQSIERRVLRYLKEGKDAWVKPEDPTAPKNTKGEQAMELRRRYQGGIETQANVPITNREIYNTVYAKSNVAAVCKLVQEDPESVYDLTCKNNLAAVITDGTAVLGLGNIGSGAGLPVMEGKSVLFKSFGAVEAFPICLRTNSVDNIVETVKAIAPVFGGINLEDISAPRCFEIEERLIAETDIPIFHDDQHGTAVVSVAAILNAVKAVNKPLDQVRIAVNGAGASALSVSKLLLLAGVKDITICDTKGIIYKGRTDGMNPFKEKIAETTNLSGMKGQLEDALKGADVFIGLSVAGALTQPMVKTMAKDPIILAMANPTPEIMPDEALAAGAKIVGTGRSDFPNQVNNCLAFPGIFRGTLDVRAKVINDDMKLAAARAIASFVEPDRLAKGIVIPSVFELDVHPAVAEAVAKAAIETGVARRQSDPKAIAKGLESFLKTGTFTRYYDKQPVS